MLFNTMYSKLDRQEWRRWVQDKCRTNEHNKNNRKSSFRTWALRNSSATLLGVDALRASWAHGESFHVFDRNVRQFSPKLKNQFHEIFISTEHEQRFLDNCDISVTLFETTASKFN